MLPFLAAIPYPQIDPVLFRLGPVAVRWYGLAYLAGFALGYALLLRLVRRGVLRLPAETLGDLLVWLIVGVMVGGRVVPRADEILLRRRRRGRAMGLNRPAPAGGGRSRPSAPPATRRRSGGTRR